ncbi:hypothetical protein EJ05DRAFT_490253 [Pseudovirgaria hyperparasitica]|uniref:Uncharacterized protein n=1 Tax=Pseudovirgaria hyperparasitica TaxID=470096 RepID=A0A6A6VSR6_9PEZI|nr:uncharacterized protein EJ05DRAFT_490253 [Pseudovirgaria hyperparasitica]KAF2753195.1 hypothetical protein EJ05DRAFT_490253 [Pseudovirgaria hyperparasitica]
MAERDMRQPHARTYRIETNKASPKPHPQAKQGTAAAVLWIVYVLVMNPTPSREQTAYSPSLLSQPIHPPRPDGVPPAPYLRHPPIRPSSLPPASQPASTAQHTLTLMYLPHACLPSKQANKQASSTQTRRGQPRTRTTACISKTSMSPT